MKRMPVMFLIILSACSTGKLNIHPAAVKYVNKFNYLLKKSSQSRPITNLEVHLSEKLSYRTLAVCVREPFKTPVVFLNKYYWDDLVYLKELDREEIIFHELGHCVLNREHEVNTESIMYPHHLGRTKFLMNYTKYISELFKENLFFESPEMVPVQASFLKESEYQESFLEPSWTEEPIFEVIMIKDIEDVRLDWMPVK